MEINPKTHKFIVTISGGKDSTATLFRAIELYGEKNLIGLFNDTGFEHPITYKYIRELSAFVKVLIYSTIPPKPFLEIAKQAPTSKIRRCNGVLKKEPTRHFIRQFSEPIVLLMGIRKAESKNRNMKYKDYNSTDFYKNKAFYAKKQPVYNQYPIIDWSDEETFSYIKKNGFYSNPLYKRGFKRVGCFPCIVAGKATIKEALNDPVGRKNIKDVLDVVYATWTPEQLAKQAKSYISMKDLYEEYIKEHGE